MSSKNSKNNNIKKNNNKVSNGNKIKFKKIENNNINIQPDKVKLEKNNCFKEKSNNLNDKIQSIVSILFTIVIFFLIFLLIFILYNKYLKKEKEVNKESICSEYIKKDYHINKNNILDYIKSNRYILYNIDDFDDTNINTNTINEFSKYIIWNSENEYSICDNYEYCLDTKKEMDYNLLKDRLLNYFNISNLNLMFNNNFNNDDTTRLFMNGDKVILTFKNMEYETLKHDVVDIRIDEDNIYIIFVLSKRLDENNFVYYGYKNLNLKYDDNRFIIKNIETTRIS